MPLPPVYDTWRCVHLNIYQYGRREAMGLSYETDWGQYMLAKLQSILLGLRLLCTHPRDAFLLMQELGQSMYWLNAVPATEVRDELAIALQKYLDELAAKEKQGEESEPTDYLVGPDVDPEHDGGSLCSTD